AGFSREGSEARVERERAAGSVDGTIEEDEEAVGAVDFTSAEARHEVAGQAVGAREDVRPPAVAERGKQARAVDEVRYKQRLDDSRLVRACSHRHAKTW